MDRQGVVQFLKQIKSYWIQWIEVLNEVKEIQFIQNFNWNEMKKFNSTGNMLLFLQICTDNWRVDKVLRKIPTRQRSHLLILPSSFSLYWFTSWLHLFSRHVFLSTQGQDEKKQSLTADKISIYIQWFTGLHLKENLEKT